MTARQPPITRPTIASSIFAIATILVACASRDPGETGAANAAVDANADATTNDAATTTPVETRCGPGPGAYSAVYTPADVAKLAGCTTFAGRLQEDSVADLADFSGLESLRAIEGTLNVFRSPGFVSLKGLENLETVDGDLFIHLTRTSAPSET